MHTSAHIIDTARGWLDTPFHHQGRLKGVGVDCIGLVVGVARELGIDIYDEAGYGRQPQEGRLRAALNEHLQRTLTLAPGRVVLMQWDVDPMHVGILANHPAGGLSLIHAYAKSRKVVEHALDDVWQARIAAVYIFPGSDS